MLCCVPQSSLQTEGLVPPAGGLVPVDRSPVSAPLRLLLLTKPTLPDASCLPGCSLCPVPDSCGLQRPPPQLGTTRERFDEVQNSLQGWLRPLKKLNHKLPFPSDQTFFLVFPHLSQITTKSLCCTPKTNPIL